MKTTNGKFFHISAKFKRGRYTMRRMGARNTSHQTWRFCFDTRTAVVDFCLFAFVMIIVTKGVSKANFNPFSKTELIGATLESKL